MPVSEMATDQAVVPFLTVSIRRSRCGQSAMASAELRTRFKMTCCDLDQGRGYRRRSVA